MKMIHDGIQYEITREGLLSTLDSLDVYFREAQYDVPYGRRREILIADSRSVSFNALLDYLKSAVKVLTEEVQLGRLDG